MARIIRLLVLTAMLALAATGCGAKGGSPEAQIAADGGILTVRVSNDTPLSSQGDVQVRPMDGMAMVYVPAGEFTMGSEDEEVDYALKLCQQYDTNCSRGYFSVEEPAHTVVLNGFWMDKTEVTNGQYRQCQAAGACDAPGCQQANQPDGDSQPVVCIPWSQAAAYCAWAGGRLPTEAEWEYAARSSEGNRYPWGNEFNGELLNYCDANCRMDKRDGAFDDGYARSAPVGTYPAGASWVGALDMAGNVWEFVADWDGKYSPERQANPTGPASGGRRVARGGSWHASPDHVRSALRTNIGASEFSDHVGFRCVQPAP